MADSLVDFASLDSAATAVEDSAPVVEETPVVEDSAVVDETPAVEDVAAESTETETTNADGSEKSEEEKAA